MSNPAESCSYVLYVDEAGDDGLRAFKPENPRGCTEWLCLAGYLVRAEMDGLLSRHHRDLRLAIGCRQSDVLHYRDLSETKRIRACQELAKIPARTFAICSYKRTMKNHFNARAAAASGGTNQYLYNWMARLLLERATDFVFRDAEFQKDRCFMKVVFSHRGGHRFGQMKAYIEQLKAQAVGGSTWLKTREIRPDTLRFRHFESVQHYQMAGLQFADIVASAYYQGLDIHSPRWSVEPAKALSALVGRETVKGRNFCADYGLTLVPQPHKFSLASDYRAIFEMFGYKFDTPYGFR